eukprot:scaffold50839_cov32-Prasinocladus_malaysianus.AAC.1
MSQRMALRCCTAAMMAARSDRTILGRALVMSSQDKKIAQPSFLAALMTYFALILRPSGLSDWTT